jgi:hypothetical protein
MPHNHTPNAICEECGVPYYSKPAHLHRSRYCSRPCYYAARSIRLTPPNPSGMCWCGCGEETERSRSTSKDRTRVIGEYVRYRRGHCRRLSGAEYVVEDRGYKTPCWIWQRGLTRDGYGQTYVLSKAVRAHRLFYERFKGPVPRHLVVDHLCCVRSCVNPDHLEAVTHRENVIRAVAVREQRRKR